MKIAIIIAWIIFFGFLQYILKEKITQIPIFSIPLKETFITFFSSLWFYGALFCAAAGSLLYISSLKIMPISVAGPLFTIIAALITFMIGIFLYNETISFIKITGLSLAITGIILLNI